ncbi:MAG TPA: type II and III secretion system protein [Bacteroidota bacterium]|nr:type II and III secretion system protein [Bacteroidota bacterium]
MKIHILLFVVLVTSVQVGFGQARDARLRTKGYVNPQEIISLDSSMRMDQALLVINELSRTFAGKLIIDLQKRVNPINVYVVNQHWRDALDMILARAGLTYIEEPEFIQIIEQGASPLLSGQGGVPTEPPPTLEARDVKISAVFFATDVSKLQDYGVSWNFFRSKTKEPTLNGYLATGIGLGDTASPVPPNQSGTGGGGRGSQVIPALDKAIGVISSPPEFTFANIDLLVKFFGSTGMGEVITSPEVTVRNGKKGRIQVGKDIYISTRDIAGNTINQAVSTGTIIEVTPIVYTQSDTDFIYLDMTIEQSDAAPGPTINRSQVKTHALLYNGEETIIGGLFTTLEQEVREGVPGLKDLPWWFFGLRYIFGSESTVKTKNELIILLKAELTQQIRDRIPHPRTVQELINDKRMDNRKEFNK